MRSLNRTLSKLDRSVKHQSPALVSIHIFDCVFEVIDFID